MYVPKYSVLYQMEKKNKKKNKVFILIPSFFSPAPGGPVPFHLRIPSSCPRALCVQSRPPPVDDPFQCRKRSLVALLLLGGVLDPLASYHTLHALARALDDALSVRADTNYGGLCMYNRIVFALTINSRASKSSAE